MTQARRGNKLPRRAFLFMAVARGVPYFENVAEM